MRRTRDLWESAETGFEGAWLARHSGKADGLTNSTKTFHASQSIMCFGELDRCSQGIGKWVHATVPTANGRPRADSTISSAVRVKYLKLSGISSRGRNDRMPRTLRSNNEVRLIVLTTIRPPLRHTRANSVRSAGRSSIYWRISTQ